MPCAMRCSNCSTAMMLIEAEAFVPYDGGYVHFGQPVHRAICPKCGHVTPICHEAYMQAREEAKGQMVNGDQELTVEIRREQVYYLRAGGDPV